MAMIKCSECGQTISDKADSCIHCGCPLAGKKGELIIYGIKQTFLIGGKVKVFLDDVHVASVDKGQKISIPIDRDCFLTIKSGINLARGKRLIHAGVTTKIQIVYNRLTGWFQLNEFE